MYGADVDLTDLELYRGGFPHDVFRALRHDDPVRWQPYPDGFRSPPGEDGFWVLSRHGDVQAANRDSELFVAFDGPQLSHQPEIQGTMLVSMDGRDHTRLRRLVSAGFTPRMIRRLDEQARRWAVAIVDRAVEQGECDFVEQIAYPLPMNMIADILGIPVEDREHVFAVTAEFLNGGDPDRGITQRERVGAQLEMFEYGQQLGQAKRAEPQDDVWTLLSTLELENDDGTRTALSEIELDLFFMLLTVAGSETTRNAIALGLWALWQHPDQMALLRNDPGVMQTAVEEILRWASPVAYFGRRAARATEIRGVPIAEGDRVTMWFASANRDEEAFVDPFRFDLTRTPNPHVTFGGGGPHFCLGAHLARREITILFEELLARTRDIDVLAPPSYTMLGIENPVLLAAKALPVRLSAS
ncbi:MAG TPA: cytochrome P450 [Acidimicrobiia bacterium]|jgi:cytochrome P450